MLLLRFNYYNIYMYIKNLNYMKMRFKKLFTYFNKYVSVIRRDE